jgi:hypothetical protein
MKKSFVLKAACAGLWFFATTSAADTDVFSGIYSIVNPETGAEVDVMKIRKYSTGYGVFSYMGYGDEVQRGSFKAVESAGAQPNVRVLSFGTEGKLYFVPNGAESPAGPADTGYITDMAILGKAPLKRRLLSAELERGINGRHPYGGKADEREVSVRVLNYSGKALQLGVSDVDNKENAVDTDPVNGNMASAFNCCFYLRKEWNASQRVNAEIRSPDGTLHVTPLVLPKYEFPQNFEVAVNPDGHIEVLFERSDDDRPLPRPPVARE